MQDALLITVIGMGLVFTAILLLWGVMVILVRFGRRGLLEEARQRMRQRTQPETAPDTDLPAQQQAAAIAVAVALAAQDAEVQPQLFPLPSTAIVSAWQAVMRADRMRQKRNL